jgi:signal transduction histidine kinase
MPTRPPARTVVLVPTRAPRRDLLLDGVLAAVVAVVSVVTAVAAAAPGDRPGGWALGVLVAGAVTLVARRRAPVVVLVATSVSVVAYTWLDQPSTAGVSVLVATYTAVQAGHRLLTIAVVGGALLAGTAHTVGAGGSLATAVADTLVLKGWLLASGVLGEVVRKQRALAEQAERRAAAAERAQVEVARRQAGEERLRIARELHDSLTHSISIIAVQAKVAVHLARKHGAEVDPALVAIEEASSQAARELRSTLEVLRDEAPPRGPRLDEVAGLIEGAGRAGVAATLTVDGVPAPLPAEVDGAAYRIIQEALTNVARHAAPASAAVRLGFTPEALTVQVVDDGPAPPDDPPPGGGLRSMRERVDALGGRIVTGRGPQGGFRVRASLPLQRVEQSEALT